MQPFSPYYLLICTPCYANSLHAGYFHSMLQLKELLLRHRIRHEIVTVGNESLITRARNYFVSLFLSKPEYTHLMFIDSDISFQAPSILRMLSFDKEVVGGAYPKKSIHWSRILENVRQDPQITPEELETKSYQYTMNIGSSFSTMDQNSKKESDSDPDSDSDSDMEIQDGFLKVSHVAAGFLLLQRKMLESMKSQFAHLQYHNDVRGYETSNNHDSFYAWFDCHVDPIHRVYLSEDYAFCNRWTSLGGEIWVDLRCPLHHTGCYEFKGNIRTHLELPFV